MNAIRNPRPRPLGPPSVVQPASLLELRRLQLAAFNRSQIASQHITVLISQGDASVEERVSVAELLLADTGFRIVPEEKTP